MKEYQQKRMKSYRLPEAVYRQALWAVRDLPRLKENLETLEQSVGIGASVLPDGSAGKYKIFSDRTGEQAGRLAELSLRIGAMEKALEEIPAPYREGILNKLAYGIAYGDEFHPNTWKKWQQIYLYHVALGLRLY